jgi:hypothetical protein
LLLLIKSSFGVYLIRRLEKLTRCGIEKLPEILSSEQKKNSDLKENLMKMEIPKEVQAIHITQDELNTLNGILNLRQSQWENVQHIMETQKQKQKGDLIRNERKMCHFGITRMDQLGRRLRK